MSVGASAHGVVAAATLPDVAGSVDGTSGVGVTFAAGPLPGVGDSVGIVSAAGGHRLLYNAIFAHDSCVPCIAVHCDAFPIPVQNSSWHVGIATNPPTVLQE